MSVAPARDDVIKGRTALVTGAGNGLGRAMAMALAEQGAHVVLVGRTLERLSAVAAEIDETDPGRRLRHLECRAGRGARA